MAQTLPTEQPSLATCNACLGSCTVEQLSGGPHRDRFARQVECEECSGSGVHRCTYCNGLATAGSVQVDSRHEWQCETCSDELNTPSEYQARQDARDDRADYERCSRWDDRLTEARS